MPSFLNLKAILSLNGSGFQLGLKQAESAATSMATNIKRQFIAAFGVGALVAYAKKVVEFADEITDLSDRLDISTKALQEWGYAARKSGSSIQAVTQFFEHLAVAKEKALNGDNQSQNLFWKFGINPKDLNGIRLNEIGRQIANRVKSGDTQDFISPLREIGGKSATQLIPLFKGGFDEMAAAANKAGQVIESELLTRIKALKNELQDIAAPATPLMAKVLAVDQVKLAWVVDKMKQSFLGLKAFGSGLWGGKGITDSALDAMSEAWTVRKDRATKEGAIQAAAENYGGGGDGYNEAVKRIIRDSGQMKNISFETASRKIYEMAAQDHLTQNQQAGAFVRHSPADRYLNEIARNTAITAENTRQQALSRISGGIFDGKEEW